MTTQEALEIVSYKLGAKNGTAALTDTVLIPKQIEQAVADKENGTLRAIDAKTYMQAMKLVKEERLSIAKKEGEAFLEKNQLGPEVVTTASGLQYKVLKTSEGDKPQLSDTVTVHYRGTLIDGTTFDSSYDRDTPATFAVGKVIEGWKEGLQLMNVGSTYQFFIPQELAYGDRGAGSSVPPFATLIFEVELLSIN